MAVDVGLDSRQLRASGDVRSWSRCEVETDDGRPAELRLPTVGDLAALSAGDCVKEARTALVSPPARTSLGTICRPGPPALRSRATQGALGDSSQADAHHGDG